MHLVFKYMYWGKIDTLLFHKRTESYNQGSFHTQSLPIMERIVWISSIDLHCGTTMFNGLS